MRPTNHINIYEAYINSRSIVSEANIFSTKSIEDKVGSILRDRGVTDERIINWIKKAEVRYFQNNQNDGKNTQDQLIAPHRYTAGEPEWAKRTYDVSYTEDRSQFLSHVLDYLSQTDDDYLNKLFKKTPEIVYNQEIPQWDAQMKKNAAAPNINDLKEGVDFKVLKSYGTHKVVQLLTPKAAKCEGDTMGHCAGGYNPKKLISLYDSNNNPHVTLEMDGDKVKQIKGKGNAAPVEKYKPMIKDFIQQSKLKVVGDGNNIGMRNYKGMFYFPESKEWEDLWNKEVLPAQKKAVDDILKQIVTVQNEKYTYVINYLDKR